MNAEIRSELAPHDVGGHDIELLDLSEKPKQWWERKIDALLMLIVTKNMFSVNELRKGVESTGDQLYTSLSYFERWTISICKGLIDNHVISPIDIDEALGTAPLTEEILFKVGDTVTIRDENFTSRWIRPHLRTPGYLFGQTGIIERICGLYENPETAAYRIDSLQQPLYRVRFNQKDVWPEYTGNQNDTIDVEVYQHWLLPPGESTTNYKLVEENIEFNPIVNEPHHHDHDHHHEHGEHDHVHEKRQEIEQNAVEREGKPGSVQNLAETLITVLISKQIITKQELRRAIEIRESDAAEMRGVRVVAKAWMDEEFKQRLLADGNKAIGELGITIDVRLIVVENTPKIHNVIVCTLCSCYPRQLLGMPPDWYKSRSYRARVPREPRTVLKEFGTDVGNDIQVRVHDSTADMRYMVLPQRPEGTEDFTEEQLLKLINRDSLIGVTFATSPTN